VGDVAQALASIGELMPADGEAYALVVLGGAALNLLGIASVPHATWTWLRSGSTSESRAAVERDAPADQRGAALEPAVTTLAEWMRETV
jgi:hypothetical protein